MFLLVGLISRPDSRMVGLAMVTAFIMLSLVPLIGWSGQISLAQITFVGIGAWAAVEFASGGGQVFGLEVFSAGSPFLLLVGAYASSGRGGDEGAAALSIAGVVVLPIVGGVIGYEMTDVDADEVPVAVGLAPTLDGRGAVGALGVRF